MSLELELGKETEKWLSKMEKLYPNINALNKKGEELVVNIGAYISDARNFFRENDLIKAFEAVVWAWAIAEIGKMLDAVDYIEPNEDAEKKPIPKPPANA